MLEGWSKSIDTRTGRAFYANHTTKMTQWEAPPGWIDEEASTDNMDNRQPLLARSASVRIKDDHSQDSVTSGGARTAPVTTASLSNLTPNSHHHSTEWSSSGIQRGAASELGGDWEVMYDKSSGRPFYVDHVQKITTWEHPGAALSRLNTDHQQANGPNPSGNGRTGFGVIAPLQSIGNFEIANMDSETNSSKDLQNSGSFETAFREPWQNSTQAYRPPPKFTSTNGSIDENKPSTYTTPSVEDDFSSRYYSALNSDFTVVTVNDSQRQICPSCQVYFSIALKRRHHCRLCGDVFCDACSNHKVLLPMEGAQYEKAVRVCDFCFMDVEKHGNFFSMRRYLTPLQLFDFKHPHGADNKDEKDGVGSVNSLSTIKLTNVTTALSALSQDLDQVLLDATSFEDKVTIPAHVLVPAISRYLDLDATADRAIRALSGLLALGNVVGDDSFAHAVYIMGIEDEEKNNFLDSILKLLEWSGSSNRTLAVQEQAARALYYLSDIRVLSTLLSMEEDGSAETGVVNSLDIHRTLEIMLDHAISSASPSVQRWAAASIRNLVTEDQRRTCDAIAKAIEFGQDNGFTPLQYESFTSQLASTGGVTILCSLIGAEDSDTRAHATAALSATIAATRAIDAALDILKQAKTKSSGGQEINKRSDAVMVSAIVNGGGCGTSLAQLLLSADDAVAGMGGTFASSLVRPLLRDPRGSVLPVYHVSCTFSSANDYFANGSVDEDGLGAYREAALALANNRVVLSALVQLLHGSELEGRPSRSKDVKLWAMEVLAAIALTMAYWTVKLSGPSNNNAQDFAGQVSEESAKTLNDVIVSIAQLEDENVAQVALTVYRSAAARSLNPACDSIEAQLRDAATLVMGGLASCSLVASAFLRSHEAVTSLVSAAGDDRMIVAASVLRGDWASCNLGMLEASSIILVESWKISQRKRRSTAQREKPKLPSLNLIESQRDLRQNLNEMYRSGLNRNVSATSSLSSSSSSTSLDVLLEALDTGIVPLVSRIIVSKTEYHVHDNAFAGLRLKIASCHILAAMFGIARNDSTNIGSARIYDAIDSDGNSSRLRAGRQQSSRNLSYGIDGQNVHNNLISSVVSLLQSTLVHSQTYGMNQARPGLQLPLGSLMEACLLACGSICGALVCSFLSRRVSAFTSTDGEQNEVFSTADFALTKYDKYSPNRQDACVSVCNVLCNGMSGSGSFLPPLLVGAFGEGSILPTLRLTLAIAHNGPPELHSKLAHSGLLIPVCDILRTALMVGERYTFSTSLALVRFCGQHVTASQGENGALNSLRECIKTVTDVLTIEEHLDTEETQLATLRCLKVECIFALEALSINASLWNSIAQYAVHPISSYLLQNNDWDEDDIDRCALLCAALRTIQRIIPLPSHALSAARAGIGTPLSNLVCGRKGADTHEDVTVEDTWRSALRQDRERTDQVVKSDNVQQLALEVLHTLASHSAARRGDEKGAIGLFYCGTIGAACFALGNNATVDMGVSSYRIDTSAASLTKLGIELLQYLLCDIDNPEDFQPAQSTIFVEAIAKQTRFIRALCATMLQSSESGYLDSLSDKLHGHITPMEETSLKHSDNFSVASLYGSPLVLFDGTCAGFQSPHQAAVSTLFSVAVHSSITDSSAGETFWETFLIKEDRKLVTLETKQATVAAACAIFLSILMDEKEGVCVPKTPSKQQFYHMVALPLVRKRLLDGLRSNLANVLASPKTRSDNTSSEQPSIYPHLRRYKIPQICIALCADVELLNSALQTVELLMATHSSEILPMLVSDKYSFLALLDLLNREHPDDVTTSKRTVRFVSKVIGTTAQLKIFGPAAAQLGLRNEAIASLSAALLCGEKDVEEDGNDHFDVSEISVTSSCLLGLISVLSAPDVSANRSSQPQLQSSLSLNSSLEMTISGAEAKALASNLGKKLSEMVVSRFVKHGAVYTCKKLGDSAFGSCVDVRKYPEVELLCALATKKESLPDICAHGGLQALSLVAAEGNVAAITALHEACKGDPTTVLEVEGHLSVMHVLTCENEHMTQEIYLACLEFLATLVKETQKGLLAVASTEDCFPCIDFSSNVICCLVAEDGRICSDIEAITNDAQSGDDTESNSCNGPIMSWSPLVKGKLFDMKNDNGLLELAGFSFLTSLIRVNECRRKIFQNPALFKAATSLATETKSLGYQHAAVTLLAAVSRYVGITEDDCLYTVTSLSTTFSAILTLTPTEQSQQTQTELLSSGQRMLLDYDLILALAVAANECLFDAMSDEAKIEVSNKLSDQFVHVVDAAMSMPNYSARRAAVKRNRGLLTYNISSIFLLFLGCSTTRQALLNTHTLSAMVRLIVANAANEAAMMEMMRSEDTLDRLEDKINWDAAVTNCLQCLSVAAAKEIDPKIATSWQVLISDAEKSVDEAQVKKSEGLLRSTILISKDGNNDEIKDSHISFLAALRTYADGSDASKALASRRVLERISF